MAFKVFALFALVAVANAGLVVPGAHLVAHDSPAHYNYAYQVSDPLTGDHKHQEETRHGDAVQGSYSLVESDGTRRVVEYAADDVHGFNAVVRKEPLAAHVAQPVAHVAHPVASTYVAAPAVHHVAHHVAQAHHVAPVHHVAGLAASPLAHSVYTPYHAAAYSHPVYSPYHHLGNYVY